MIQVHVIEARDLKPRDFGDTSDPVAEVCVMSAKKSTQIHKEYGIYIDHCLANSHNIQSI